MARTRIGIIRLAIIAEGGKAPMTCGIDYFCDGPGSDAAGRGGKLLTGSTRDTQRNRNEVIYKVPKYADGLTDEERERVIDALREHPDVKDAYLSHQWNRKTSYYQLNASGGHLKVVFQDTIRENPLK